MKKTGHRLGQLAKHAHDHGLPFDEGDIDTIGLIPPQEIERVQYIKTGAGQRLPILAFEMTCRSLREAVGQAPRDAGNRVQKPRVRKPLI